jgi:predicted MPP superfamily phosphohydrolase
MIKQTIKNLNDATQVVLEALFTNSKLSESGGSVKGQIEPDEIFLLLIKLFYPKIKSENKTWGSLMQDGHIENCEIIEDFALNLISALEGKGIIKREYSWLNTCEFTLTGYKSFLKSKTKNEKHIVFFEDKAEIKRDPNQTISKVVEISSETESVKLDLLKEINTFNNLFKRKISLGELEIRYLSSIYPEVKKFSSTYELMKSKKYETKSIESASDKIEDIITECFRDDLVNLNQGYLNLTKIGEKFLNIEDAEEIKKTIEQEKTKQYLSTQIIHISDLHFGSSENTNVDNKEKLESVSKFKNSNFNIFKNTIRDITNENTLLVISGDITSKNEIKGYEDCLEELKKINIRHENIYLIPGNHDVDRIEKNERLKFSNFITFFSEYSNCFSKPRFLINDDEKIILYGFNTVHHEGDDELFFLHNEDIEQFDKDLKNLSTQKTNLNQYTKIAIIHNNIIPHPNVEVKKFSEMFNLFKFKYELISKGFSIVLSGHKHQPIIEKQNIFIDDFKGEILIMSAGSLCGLTANIKNSFQIINLKRDSESLFLHKSNVEVYEMNSVNEFKLKNEYQINFE